jgi:hypothetical protein
MNKIFLLKNIKIKEPIILNGELKIINEKLNMMEDLGKFSINELVKIAGIGSFPDILKMDNFIKKLEDHLWTVAKVENKNYDEYYKAILSFLDYFINFNPDVNINQLLKKCLKLRGEKRLKYDA